MKARMVIPPLVFRPEQRFSTKSGSEIRVPVLDGRCCLTAKAIMPMIFYYFATATCTNSCDCLMV
jgi:hypothetical protein